jgi:hypothetical protein
MFSIEFKSSIPTLKISNQRNKFSLKEFPQVLMMLVLLGCISFTLSIN